MAGYSIKNIDPKTGKAKKKKKAIARGTGKQSGKPGRPAPKKKVAKKLPKMKGKRDIFSQTRTRREKKAGA